MPCAKVWPLSTNSEDTPLLADPTFDVDFTAALGNLSASDRSVSGRFVRATSGLWDDVSPRAFFYTEVPGRTLLGSEKPSPGQTFGAERTHRSHGGTA